MVRRINVPSSSRLLCTVLCLASPAMFAHAQSAESAQQRSASGSTFVVAPSVALAAAPTSVAAGDLNGDGRLDLVVTTLGSEKVTVLLGNGKGGFEPGAEYAAGTRPGSVLLADLSRSGRLDAVVTDSATGAIEVLRGNGDGTFAKPESLKAIANPVAMALGAFGGKGKLDLAVASATGLAVLLNDGTGHFSAASSIPLNHPLRSLAAADLRGEGHDDLIAANGDGTITVLKGDGEGRFSALAASKVGSGPLSSVVSGDFNRDGRADIAVVQANSNSLTVLLGRGDGSFEAGTQYTVGNNPAAVIVADLKGSGGSDLITANAASNTFSVLVGKGDGTFQTAVDFTAGKSPFAIAAGDFNGDGHADLAILNAGDGTISLPLGHGDGTFHAAPSYRTGLEQKAIATGDLTGDGLPDLVVSNFCGGDAACKSNGNATVMLASRNGAYRQGATYELGSGPVAVALADLNGDKKLDLIAVNRTDKTLMVLPGKGNGKFGEPQIYSLAANPRAVFAGDFNGDGRPDLAIASDCGRSSCSEPGSVDIWLGQENGKLALSASYTVGFSPASIAAGDLRGTGHLDLLVANTCGDESSCKSHGTATLLKGDGKGKFADGGEIDLGSAPSSIAIGNLTGKGLDLVVAERGSDQIAVLHGNGKGGFGEPVLYKSGAEPAALAIADFDGDGRLDVAVANFKDSTVSVLSGTAKGTLKSAVTYPVGAGPESMVSVKGSKSGSQGLVTANGNSGAKPMGADVTALLNVHPDVQTATTTNLSESPLTSGVVDQEITLTAVVAGNTTNPPTGSVTFSTTDNLGNITGTLTCIGPNDNTLTVGATSSSATCNVFLTQGAYFFEASYTDDANNASSNSATPSAEYDVDTAPTTTTVSTPTGQSADSLPVTVTASVAPTTAPANPANVQPIGGSGSFSIDGGAFAPCTGNGMTYHAVSGTASAQCIIPAGTLSDGQHFISTSFSPSDTNYAASSGYTFLTVGGTSQTAVTFSAAPTLDAQVTITAKVTALVGGSGTPTGTITFSGTVPGCGSPSEVVVPMSGGKAVCMPPISTLSATTGGPAYSVTATYNPNAASNYLTSNSGAQALAVAEATPAPQTPAPITATIDAPFSITAVVAPPSGVAVANEVPIGGSVTFKNGAAAVAGCTSAIPVNYNTTTGQSTATCTPALSGLTATSGTPDTINATYSGDGNYNAGPLTPFSLTINKQNSVTTLASSLNPSPVSTPETFTATVAPPNGIAAAVAIGGSITFTYNGGTPIPNCLSPVNVVFSPGNGVATAACSPPGSFFAIGSYTITATYSGDNNYLSGNPATLTQAVNLPATTTTVSPVSNSTVDQPLTTTLTATVTSNAASAGSFALGSTVTFLDNLAAIPACPNPQPVTGTTSGTATCPGFLLTAGAHSITASYSGNINYVGSPASAAKTFTVAQANTNTATSVSGPATSYVNAPVTLNATVTPFPRPSPVTNLVPFSSAGTVSFLDGSNPITGCQNIPVTVGASSAAASCATSVLVDGPHTINAMFNGDSNYNASTSASGSSHTEVTNGTSAAVSSNLNPAALSQTVIFTATVTPNSGPIPPAIAPTGTVLFKDGSNTICGASVLNPSGMAQCSTSTLSAGLHTITVKFNTGDSNYTDSGGATLSPQQQIVQNLTQTALVTSPNGASTVDQAVTLTDTITESGGTSPTGTVAFTVNGSPIPGCASVQLTTSAPFTATCITPGIPVLGTAGAGNTINYQANALKATYSGDSNYGSGIATASLTVRPEAATATTVSSFPPPPVEAVVNQSTGVTLTANIYWNTAGSSIPASGVPITGTLQFLDSGNPVAGCNSSITVNTATSTGSTPFFTKSCNTTALTAGPHTISAAFTPTANTFSYAASTSTALPLALTADPTAISVSSSLQVSAFNQPVTFTATVTFQTGGVPLTGTVNFNDESTKTPTLLCSETPTPAGIATCTTHTLAAGTHNIVASFVPATATPNFLKSTSAVFQQTVQQSATTTTLSTLNSSGKAINSSKVNGAVTLKAMIAADFANGNPLDGTVAFQFGGANLAQSDKTSCASVKLSSSQVNSSGVATGVAYCNLVESLPAGSDTITATYSNDTHFGQSTGQATIKVSEIKLNVTLATPPSPILVQSPVTYKMTVQLPSPYAVKLSGTATFLHDNAVITCEKPPKVDSTTGIAECSTTAFAAVDPTGAGKEQITATYSGDTNYIPVGPSPQPETVQDFSLTLSATPPVAVTQGYTNSSDPVAPDAINVIPISIGGFDKNLLMSCNVSVFIGAKTARVPKCTFIAQFPKEPSNFLEVDAAGAQRPLPVVIDATGADPGTYTVAVTGNVEGTTLSHTTTVDNSLTIYVNSAANLNPNQLTSNAPGNTGKATVTFVIPQGSTFTPNLSPKGEPWCTEVTGLSLATPVDPKTLGIACSASPTTTKTIAGPNPSEQITLPISVTTTATPPGSYDILIQGTATQKGLQPVVYEAVIKLVVTL